MTRLLRRYDDPTRLAHWAVVMLFFYAGLSGLALFHPALFPLGGLFGGGAWTRVLHPFFGVLMVLGFGPLFSRLWRENRWLRRDTDWLRAAPRLMTSGDERQMPPAGRYNGGQKAIFWLFAISLPLLLVTGVVFWQPWFADQFAIPLRRVAVAVHATSAAVLILGVIVHAYAALWVRGTMQAMLRGEVSERWARQHHPLWYREVTGESRGDG